MKKLTNQNINCRIVRQLATAGLILSLSSAWAQTPVKIGFLAELSGPTAGVGQDQLDGFNLVVERNGGKLGGVPVTLIKEDSQLKPDVANQAVRRLIEKENVPIITGVSFSNIMMAVHKYVTDKEVFFDWLECRAIADCRNAVLAVPVHYVLAGRPGSRGCRSVCKRQGV
jgi:branched-chain amino acid transport system substrate-binding protein